MTLHKPVFQLSLELDLPDVDMEEGWVTPEVAALRLEQARAFFDASLEKPSWFADYERLRDGGWPFRVAMYIAWASSPRKERRPDTMQELASLMGLKSARAINTWRARNPAIDEQVALMQAAPLFQHRADLFQASLNVALTADYKGFNDRKLLLEMLGDYVPRSQVDVGRKAKGLEDLSDADLQALLGNKLEEGIPVEAEDEDAGAA